MSLPTVFQQCKPRPEILGGELPDSLFAADLWDVLMGRAHSDYQDPERFFAGTYPTENMKTLVKEVAERLPGVEGGNPVFYLESGGEPMGFRWKNRKSRSGPARIMPRRSGFCSGPTRPRRG